MSKAGFIQKGKFTQKTSNHRVYSGSFTGFLQSERFQSLFLFLLVELNLVKQRRMFSVFHKVRFLDLCFSNSTNFDSDSEYWRDYCGVWHRFELYKKIMKVQTVWWVCPKTSCSSFNFCHLSNILIKNFVFQSLTWTKKIFSFSFSNVRISRFFLFCIILVLVCWWHTWWHNWWHILKLWTNWNRLPIFGTDIMMIFNLHDDKDVKSFKALLVVLVFHWAPSWYLYFSTQKYLDGFLVIAA